MDKFPNANIRFSSQNKINCTRVEPYNICYEYIVNPCIGVSIIPNSTNVDVQDQIMPTHEFHSLPQKANNKHLIFYDVIYKKKQNPNEPIHLFITGGVGTSKIFTLMFLVQVLICFYNRHPNSNPLKKITLFMAYI
jgi:hypothetical protein